MKKIARSRYFIFCVSNAALKKTGDAKPGFVDKELQRAYEIAMNQSDYVFTIVPVRLEDCERGDTRISTYQQYDLFMDFEKELDRLAVHIGGISLADARAKDERKEDEKLIDSLFGKAEIAYYSGEYNKALSMYDAVINIDSENQDAWYGKGIVLAESGKKEEPLRRLIKP